jgi:hypothetical protein
MKQEVNNMKIIQKQRKNKVFQDSTPFHLDLPLIAWGAGPTLTAVWPSIYVKRMKGDYRKHKKHPRPINRARVIFDITKVEI